MRDLQEKVFFGQARHELERVVGVPNMETLSRTENISILPAVFNVSQRLYKGTLDDSRERYAFFELKNDDIVVSKEGTAGEINFKTLEVRGWESGPLDTIRMFFGNPVSVFFHTHPKITPAYLESRGVRTPKMYGQPVTLEQAAQLLTFQMGVFSDSDLVFVEKGVRYFR